MIVCFERAAVAFLAMLSLHQQESRAETLLSYDTYIETIIARVCDTLSDAIIQAPKSRELGRHAQYQRGSQFHHCKFIAVSARYFERVTTIEPYLAWVPVFDPNSSKKIPVPVDGKEYLVPVSNAKRFATFYRALIDDGYGPRIAWVELSTDPYVLKWMAVTGIRGRGK